MEMLNTTKIVLAWELGEQGVPKVRIAEILSVNRDTVRLWIQGIEKVGLVTFLDAYTNAKKVSRPRRQVDAVLKRRIWMLRDREKNCCGQKIQYFLEKEYQVKPALSKIYEILAEKYVIKSKWKKNVMSGPVPAASKAREVIQMDTIDFGGIFAFTGIDIYSREADVFLAPELTAAYGYAFLRLCMERRFGRFSELIQTDGGSEFKEEFKKHVLEYTKRHRVSHPYKKNEQSFIESFNRTVRKECLGWVKYRPKEIPELTSYVETFLERYHYHRPHIGLGMKTPLGRS
jgi:hypothetical protein